MITYLVNNLPVKNTVGPEDFMGFEQLRISMQALPEKLRERNSSYLGLSHQHYPDTKLRQQYCKKKKTSD